MAEPFKNELSLARIRVIANHLSQHDEDFNKKYFLAKAGDNLDELSLMERNRQIVTVLKTCLPTDFKQAQKIIIKSLAPIDKQQDKYGLHSWLTVPLAEYVGQNGIDHFNEAMNALKAITPFFSSEWGIRHLIIHKQEQSLKLLNEWCDDPSDQVRRLVSEGSRPRVPWGMHLSAFIDKPALSFPLLEKLKDDPSDYVRLSVANHLNDISKDHPDWLQKKLVSWMQPSNKVRMKLIRHACRTLIKQGHKGTLKMLGYDSVKTKHAVLSLNNKHVNFGDSLKFDISIQGPSHREVILDYVIHFKKANGELKPKVFKWKLGKLNKEGVLIAKKSHAIKAITTRKYYNGEHKMDVILNGDVIAQADFTLTGVVD